MSTFSRRMAGSVVATVMAAGLVPLLGSTAHAGPGDGTSRNPARIGLYGQQTPRYDGVYRQGLTIIALHDRGVVQPKAIRWLKRQQCGNGSWTSFRSKLTEPCGPRDSNATAMAVMALKAVGAKKRATRGTEWLIHHQLAGGGWEYSKGWGADSNSTGLAVQALIAMRIKPRSVTNNGSPFDFLTSLQIGCDSSHLDQRGALDYQEQHPLVRNDYATAQAAQALARTTLPVQPRVPSPGLPTLECGSKVTIPANTPAKAAAGYLGRRLKENDGTIPSAFGGGTDYGSTANAVLSLVATGYGANQATKAMAGLEAAVRDYALDASGQVLPAAAALMVLAERATGGGPRNVDGLNLVKRLKKSITERA